MSRDPGPPNPATPPAPADRDEWPAGWAYGLIFIISLLSAVLSDSEFPWEGGDIMGGVPGDSAKRYGSTYMVLDPAVFLPAAEFRSRVDKFIDDLKSSPTKAGVDEILYPGERSQRLKRGTAKVAGPAPLANPPATRPGDHRRQPSQRLPDRAAHRRATRRGHGHADRKSVV